MTASARQRLTRFLLSAAIAVVGMLTGCATTPRGTPAAPVSTACGTGRTEWADPFCGARLGQPAAILCALPGHTSRRGFMDFGGQLAVRLADASYIHAELMEDSATAEAVIHDVADPPPLCAMEVRTLTRNWPPLTDAGRVINRYAVIAAQLDASFSDATSRCRVRVHPSGWTLVREMVTPQRVVTREFGSFRSSDAAEEKQREAAETFLRTLKVTIGWPSGQSRDTSTVRQRYAIGIDMSPSAPHLYEPRDTIGFETGAAACDKLEQRTLERVRREAR